MIPARFFHPFYVVHTLLILSYIYVRSQIDIRPLKKTDFLGFEWVGGVHGFVLEFGPLRSA